MNPYVTFDPGVANLGGLTVEALSAGGERSLSTPYAYRVDFTVNSDAGLSDESIDDLLSHPVRLAIGRESSTEVHGIVRELEMVSTGAGERARYVAAIVPRLWELTLNRRTRVWQDSSHLDIVKRVLAEHQLLEDEQVRDACNDGYEALEYVVQYQESDFDFISRLLEHQGVHYRFVSEPDTEVLVLGDDNRSFETLPGLEQLTYDPSYRYSAADPVVVSLVRRRRPRARTVAVRDYDWRAPNLAICHLAQADQRTGRGFVDLYGEHVRAEGGGARLARLRAEEHQIEHDVFEGVAAFRGLTPGTRFELLGHPNPDLDQEYLVTAIREDVEGDTGGEVGALVDRVSFTAIPARVPYRPRRVTPRPRIQGLQHGKIDGATRSTAAPIDERGRYKVVLPFDEVGREGGAASRWIRAAQPSAGSDYGVHFPLHVGTEVVIAHIDGDPDRPIIVGAVPNQETGSPVTRANATHSRIRTGSGIVIELDDDCG